MVASVLLFHSQHSDIDLQAYKFDKQFNLDFLWTDLLRSGRLPNICQFPPEFILTLGNTLELQATRMLLAASKHTNTSINIDIPYSTSNNKPIIYKIAKSIENNTLEFDSSLKLEAGINILVSDHPEPHTLTPSFTKVDDILAFESSSRQLFAFWMDDEVFFKTMNQNSTYDDKSLVVNLWNYRQTENTHYLLNSTEPLLLHYLHATVSLHNEVIVDRTFSRTYDNTPNDIWAELIIVYSHLKCGLPYPVDKLDVLIERCKAESIPYWEAYLQTYGQSLRAYSGKFIPAQEQTHAQAGYRSFKSLNDYIGMTRALHAKSSLLSKKGNVKGALKLLEICCRIREYLQEPLGVAKIYNGMAYICSKIDQLDQALDFHRKAENKLSQINQYDELAFTYNLMSWNYFLQGDYSNSVELGLKTLKTMDDHNIQTLAFRTKPDIHSQLGLSLFFDGQFESALEHSNFCESHKVDSSATGELFRSILRGLINDQRGDRHLADISFKYIPELIEENAEVDPHIEALYYLILTNRLDDEVDSWKIEDIKKKGKALCLAQGMKKTMQWFD